MKRHEAADNPAAKLMEWFKEVLKDHGHTWQEIEA